MLSLKVPARLDQLEQVLDFVSSALAAAGCPLKPREQMRLAAEEIFVNIACYAYDAGAGEAAVSLCLLIQPPQLSLEFRDQGRPFNPLRQPAPDISLAFEARPLGGLGIYLAQELTDSMAYAYEDGENSLTLYKSW